MNDHKANSLRVQPSFGGQHLKEMMHSIGTDTFDMTIYHKYRPHTQKYM